MGLMDKAKQAVKGRSAQLERGVDQAAKMVDKRTGGKYRDKVAKGADQLKSKARTLDEDRREPSQGTNSVHGSNQETTGGTAAPAGGQDATLTNGHGDRSAPRATAASDPTSGSGHLGEGPITADPHEDQRREP